MRIVTLNVNGIRSAAAKGFVAGMRGRGAEVVCLEETKAQPQDLPRSLLAPRGLHAHFHSAEKRGYSGVAIYTRREPDQVTLGLGIPDIDAQGRFLQLDFAGLSVVSLYMPSGSSGDPAQPPNIAFIERFIPPLEPI